MVTGLVAGLAGCDGQRTDINEVRVQHYETTKAPRQAAGQAPELATLDSPMVSLTQAVAATQPAIDDVVSAEIPDPSQAEAVYRERLRTYSETIQRDYEAIFFGDDEAAAPQPGAVRYVSEIVKDKQVRLGLNEVIRRSLANNYQIHFEGYGPAISTAQIVQAEAAFDAAFFTNLNRTDTDRPRVTAYAFNESQINLWQTGVRKLLATGATASLTYQFDRTYSKLPAAARPNAINPSYTQNFITELRQPFLRNFGIDFNRAQINIQKNTRIISEERFRRNVIDVLNRVEQAYWTLVQARRNVVVSAELLSQAERTLAQVKARIDYDAYETLRYNSEAQVASRQADFIVAKNTVRDSEDALLNIMNDPDYPVAGDWEVIPTDIPTTIPVVRDRFHEVETALVRRPEINEARHAVENARIQMGIAKNQALPRLDVIYRWTANGLGREADLAFDQMSGGDWTDTFVGMEFLWNFGERAERAGIRAAAMAHSQSIFAFKRALDDVVTDVRTTLRQLQTSYEQINPSANAVRASAENLRSIQEREERKSPEQLNTVFNAQSQLAQNRSTLLQALTTYNQAIVNVERAKGTLLEYDNVFLSEVP